MTCCDFARQRGPTRTGGDFSARNATGPRQLDGWDEFIGKQWQSVNVLLQARNARPVAGAGCTMAMWRENNVDITNALSAHQNAEADKDVRESVRKEERKRNDRIFHRTNLDICRRVLS